MSRIRWGNLAEQGVDLDAHAVAAGGDAHVKLAVWRAVQARRAGVAPPRRSRGKQVKLATLPPRPDAASNVNGPTFGAWRRAHRYTQEQVGAAFEVGHASVRRWEREAPPAHVAALVWHEWETGILPGGST
jgi:hypothetical protein